MPRPYHSPSSIALGDPETGCPRAWAYTYLEGNRDPELPWRPEYACIRGESDWKWDHGTARYWAPDESASITAQQRGASLGKGLHGTAERYYDPSRGEPDWAWFPGRVFASGKHLLPEPDKVRAIVEHEIGDEPLPVRHDHKQGQPTRTITIHGVRWAGFRDLLTHGGDELRRLKIDAPDGIAFFDYKTSSDFTKFALTPDELRTDPQCALYTVDACNEFNLKALPARWVYFGNKKKREALPIDIKAELSRALDVLGPCADIARKLDELTRVEDAPKNPATCYKFGNPERINCRFHVVNGGPCNAWGAFRQLVQIKKKEEIVKMATPTAEERKAAFEKKKAEMAAAKAAAAGASTAPAESAEEKSEAPAEGAEVQEEASPPATEAVKPKPATAAKPATTPKPSAAKPVEGSQAATIAALAAELAAADKARADVLERLRKAVA